MTALLLLIPALAVAFCIGAASNRIREHRNDPYRALARRDRRSGVWSFSCLVCGHHKGGSGRKALDRYADAHAIECEGNRPSRHDRKKANR